MDVVSLSRFQFATTNIFHFYFVQLTVGLAIVIAVLETLYFVRKLPVYRTLTNFWGHLFLINFAVGVVTGIVQEFQFGMNWSEYSKFVGNIFGVPLALEVLMAFFLESTFLGIWWFGKDRLAEWVRLASIWIVAVASSISAYWVIMANGWMQHPVGFVVKGEQAVMTSFAAVVFNYKSWLYFAHIWGSALSVAAFWVLGVSAYHVLRRRDADVFLRSLKIGVVFAVVGTLFSILSGHREGQVANFDQPMKFAAMEAIWETTRGSTPESIFAIPNLAERKNDLNFEIPYVGSFLAYNRFTGSVRGINDLQREYEQKFGPGNYIPPVGWVYWSFRIMVGVGLIMLLAAFAGAFLWWRKKLEHVPLYLKVLPFLIPAPYIANTFGWLTTEMGRQPWIVQDLMRTANAVSANTVGEVLAGLIGFWIVYLMLIGLDLYLLTVTARAGISHKPEAQIAAAPAPNYGGPGFQGYERRD